MTRQPLQESSARICDGEFAGRRACVCGHPELHECRECGLTAAAVVPRSEAEALAEALGNEEALSRAGYKAWAEYRAHHPKETP